MSMLHFLAQTAAAVDPPSSATANWLADPLVIGVALATVISLLLVYRHLRQASHWSMSDALSETTDVAVPLVDPKTGAVVLKKDGETPVTTQQLRASSSRLIALLGSIAIMMLYIGAGLVVLQSLAKGAGVPEGTETLSKFFLWGMVLFAPYIVNKFASIFGWLK
jgi:hypothetical protein